MHPTLNTFKILLLALVLAGGLQYALAAWGGPTAMPPGNNAAAPINVSNVPQEKYGSLYVWAGGVFSGNGVWAYDDGVRATQYCDINGENCVDGDALSSTSDEDTSPGAGFITREDIDSGKAGIYYGYVNGSGYDTMVDVSGSGYLTGGHVQGAHVNWVRIWVDGRRWQIPRRFYENERGDDNSFVTLPSIRYERSLKIQYYATDGGDIVSGQAFIVRD